MIKYIKYILILISPLLNAQDSCTIQFNPHWKGLQIYADSQYTLDDRDWLRLSVLKWYIADLSCITTDGEIFKAEKRHYLLDIYDPESCISRIQIPQNKKIAKISFIIGVDSLTQTKGAFGEDLDPTNGMYWTWQNGYIHIKVEGTSSECPEPSKAFTLHLGGYRKPYNSLQSVILDTAIYSDNIAIGIDLAAFFENADIHQDHHIMSPSVHSKRMANLFSSCFKIIKS
jgi:hypothetical protein